MAETLGVLDNVSRTSGDLGALSWQRDRPLIRVRESAAKATFGFRPHVVAARENKSSPLCGKSRAWYAFREESNVDQAP